MAFWLLNSLPCISPGFRISSSMTQLSALNWRCCAAHRSIDFRRNHVERIERAEGISAGCDTVGSRIPIHRAKARRRRSAADDVTECVVLVEMPEFERKGDEAVGRHHGLDLQAVAQRFRLDKG